MRVSAGWICERHHAGNIKPYVPGSSEIDLGVDILPKLTAPAEDRNRTSPFPYGGARFEFRAVGSSQNVSLVNTVLNTMIAEEFNNLCDKVDAGAKPVEVAQAMLKDHMKVSVEFRRTTFLRRISNRARKYQWDSWRQLIRD